MKIEVDERGLRTLMTVLTLAQDDDDVKKLILDIATQMPEEDFGLRLERLMAEGYDDEAIIEMLDPDTAGTDLLALVRHQRRTVDCKFCRRLSSTLTSHAHGDSWVCERCWDERLRTTS